MSRAKLVKRLEALEEAQREWEANHVKRSDLPGFLFAVLTIVHEEAGQDTFERVAGRIVGQKAARVASLSGGAR